MKVHLPGTPMTSRGTPITSRHKDVVNFKTSAKTSYVSSITSIPQPFSLLLFFSVHLVVIFICHSLQRANSLSRHPFLRVWVEQPVDAQTPRCWVHPHLIFRCIPCRPLPVAMLVLWRNSLPHLSVPTLGCFSSGCIVLEGGPRRLGENVDFPVGTCGWFQWFCLEGWIIELYRTFWRKWFQWWFIFLRSIQEYANVQSISLVLLRQFASEKFLRNICPTKRPWNTFWFCCVMSWGHQTTTGTCSDQFLPGFLRVTHLSLLFYMFALSIRTGNSSFWNLMFLRVVDAWPMSKAPPNSA